MKVLKIGAEWCPGCVIMKPRWAEVEAEMPNLETIYYDADENEEILKKYEVKDLPTFIFLDKDENIILKMDGEISKEELLKVIEENINK